MVPSGVVLDLASTEVLVVASALSILDRLHADAQRGCEPQQPSCVAATLRDRLSAWQTSAGAEMSACVSATAWVALAQVRVWDVRMYKPRHAYFSHAPVEALDISQRGLLALGHGRTVQVGVRRGFHRARVPDCASALKGGTQLYCCGCYIGHAVSAVTIRVV